MNDFPGWLQNLVGKGPWKCRCGKPLDHPGVCDDCSTRSDRRNAERLTAQALESIPLRFRDCVYGREALVERVQAEPIRSSLAIVDGLMRGDVEGAVLIGPARAGKTSIACAMLRELADRRAAVAWRACFVRATDLGVCRKDAPLGTRPRIIEEACSASLLLLDDLGQEDDVGPLREVIHARHDSCRPIIATTSWNQESLQTRYGGGMDRRLFERSAVLLMEGKAQ